ncbi:hypothetical protein WT56_26385 [Burkholderia pseudomultivorans]|uniref:Uncharacterized protein n=1 Tax=Burkholderia pseudomultivorans TaxID=1207504 RepID=A0A132EAB1_9BURK|nr:hypothetical protein WT56_26385 [Burkholderia pseudomultivorans]
MAEVDTLPNAEWVVSVAVVDNQAYETDTPTDQCLSMLYVRPALTTGAKELFSDADVGPSKAVPVVGDARNWPVAIGLLNSTLLNHTYEIPAPTYGRKRACDSPK